MNSIFAIRPYKTLGFWVFDDEARGLKEEPFVGGADTLIDLVTSEIPDAREGFAMLFSDQAFPGATIQMEWRRPELSGNTYWCEQFQVEGWLCPALLKYFGEPPKHIYVKVQPLA